jgi:hypothetical protein
MGGDWSRNGCRGCLLNGGQSFHKQELFVASFPELAPSKIFIEKNWDYSPAPDSERRSDDRVASGAKSTLTGKMFLNMHLGASFAFEGPNGPARDATGHCTRSNDHRPNGSTEPLRLWISATLVKKAEIAAQTREDNERWPTERRSTVAVMIQFSS